MGCTTAAQGGGILVSALLVPAALQAAIGVPHGWSWAWWALAGVCLLAASFVLWPLGQIATATGA
jgi:hypothetical protein